MKSYAVVLILVLAFVSIQQATVNAAIYCGQNPCEGKICEPVSCSPDQIITEGECGCCQRCVTIIDEGGPCSELIGGPPKPTQCREGLVCLRGKCQKL